ncbi:MAG: AmmeMemoRadiSam system protein A [Deltaproteobacteria bacterium]|jgi:AmmeMemoRadiSam system protein A|nr:AmmeMemoRadiSam system protein A [Deltaproteobacteria bacterium]
MTECQTTLAEVPGLTEDLKIKILSWSRQILAAATAGQSLPPAPEELADLRGGVFVTLKKLGKLRGCIGRFDFTGLLADAIESMVKAAAFDDPRFNPVVSSELDLLEITISVLTEPKPLTSLDDLVIGRDGLYLLHPHGRGVLLPVVAEEYGWTPLEFARQTSVKAGLNPGAWEDPKANLLVFTAPSFTSKSLD